MYQHTKILSQAEELAETIAGADAQARLKMQGQFERVLHDLKVSGHTVPAKLRRLNDQLIQETVEARFDNLPV